MKVANLCDSCKYHITTCESSKTVFGIDCNAILAYVRVDECDSKYLDAVIACDGFQDQRDL